MIEFLSEWVRNEFHLLPAQTQKEYHDLAIKFAATGQIITVCSVERWGAEDKNLEVSIRIDKKFDSVCPLVTDKIRDGHVIERLLEGTDCPPMTEDEPA